MTFSAFWKQVIVDPAGEDRRFHGDRHLVLLRDLTFKQYGHFSFDVANARTDQAVSIALPAPEAWKVVADSMRSL